MFAWIAFGAFFLLVAVAAGNLGFAKYVVCLYGAAIACLGIPFLGVLARGHGHHRVEIPSAVGGAPLICYGKEMELCQVLNGVPLPEPVIFKRTPFGFSRGCIYVLLPLGIPVMRAVGVPETSSIAMVCMMQLFFMNVRIPPEYCRVMPGRLQILRGALFSSKLKVSQEIGLADAQITCWFNKRSLLICNSCKSYMLNLREVRQPHAFVEAVFSAARFPHAPAEPSDCELLG